MKILALIPARGGSKRFPGKNIKLLGGKPLIVWSVDVAKGTPEICEILVSTDNAATAKVSKDAGALVPWLRPEELATDTASSVDVALHALEWYEAEKGKVDGLLLLQPTSPFRTQQTVRQGIRLFKDNNRQSVLGVSPCLTHPMWTLKIEGQHLVPFMPDHGLGIRSQDLPPAYAVNGSFYLSTPENLRTSLSFSAGELIPLLIDSEEEALDIDTALDFKIAESILNC